MILKKKLTNILSVFILSVIFILMWTYLQPNIYNRLTFEAIQFRHYIFKNTTLLCTKENDSFSNSLTLGDDCVEEAYEILNDTSILPPSARIVPKKIFKDKPLVIWATEWHMTPIKDLKNLLSPFGVIFIDYNLDPGRCEWHDCKAKEKLKVLTSDNVLDVIPPIPEKFYEAYKDDPEMKSVDIVLCSYPASICEIYIPFNKSVLVLPTTRYDVGRYTVERLNKLNENLRILAQKPWNVFGGNNLYDARYLQYYTGIKTRHLPSVCDYTGAEYTNEINEFLVLRRRDKGFNDIFFRQFNESCKKVSSLQRYFSSFFNYFIIFFSNFIQPSTTITSIKATQETI